jgi:hypothetical protein
MPLNMQLEEMGNNSTGKQTQSSFRRSGRKAPGTRIGLLIDWREGSTKSGKILARHGRAFRDGR